MKLKFALLFIALAFFAGISCGVLLDFPCSDHEKKRNAKVEEEETNATAEEKETRADVETISYGSLLVATEATFPPYEFCDQNQNIVGIDIDICRLVAEKLGKKLHVKDTNYEAIIPNVITKKFDVAASGITITEERKRKVLFSDPYATFSQLIIVSVNDTAIKGPEDLKGKRIGCQSGTTAYNYVAKNINPYGYSNFVLQFENGILACEALKAGKLDAVVLDEGPARDNVKRNSDTLKILDIPLTQEEYAFAFNKDSEELCKVFNEVIAELKKSGEMQKIIEKNQKLSDSLKKY